MFREGCILMKLAKFQANKTHVKKSEFTYYIYYIRRKHEAKTRVCYIVIFYFFSSNNKNTVNILKYFDHFSLYILN